MPRQVKINALMQAQLIKLMLEGEYSCAELAEMTGAHYVTVLQYTRELHRAGAAHICRYEPDRLGRRNVKIYKIGEGEDVRLRKATPRERQAARRKRIEIMRDQMAVLGLGRYVKAANGRLRFERCPAGDAPRAQAAAASQQ